MVNYNYLIELMKKYKGPCGDLILNKEACLKKIDDDTIYLSVKSNNSESTIPVNSMEELDEGFMVNGNIPINLKGVWPEFIVGYLRPEMIESMIKDSIEFIVYWRGLRIIFRDKKIKFYPMDVDLTKGFKLTQINKGLELTVGDLKLSIPGNCLILFGKRRKSEPVEDKPIWED